MKTLFFLSFISLIFGLPTFDALESDENEVISTINQSGHGGTNVLPDFQNSSKNHFISISSDQGLGTENPRSIGIKAIFAIFWILFFFKITSFSASLCRKF